MHDRPQHASALIRALPILIAAALLPMACTTTKTVTLPADVDARRLPLFDGHDGQPLSWEELMTRVGQAEVVVIGEQHDDAVGHAVQQAVVEDAMTRWPGTTAVSMEMLERDEQMVVDDFLDGVIDAKTLATLTHSASWSGPGSWAVFYQPMLDSARAHDAPVVAANAPRRYARLARTDGFERIDQLPADRRALVDLPEPTTDDGYRQRFFELMSGHDGASAPALDDEQVEAFFRGQQIWDATMAGSIADARAAGVERVIHVVGRFHSDFDGGTVQQLRARRPSVAVLVISMHPASSDTLLEDDIGRADVIVYTAD